MNINEFIISKISINKLLISYKISKNNKIIPYNKNKYKLSLSFESIYTLILK